MKGWTRRLWWTWRTAGWRAPAVVAALLAVAAVVLERGWLEAERGRVERLEALAGPGTGPDRVDAGDAARGLGAFYAQFGDPRSLPAQLAKLHQIAQAHGIALAQGQYKLQRDTDSRLLQYQIVLPVRGSYVKLRRFIASVLESMPGVALDHVSFERKRVDEESIDAQMRFVLFLLDDESER